MNVEYKIIPKEQKCLILNLWNKNLDSLFPMDERLFYGNLNMDKNIKDENFIGAYLNEELIGFIIYKQQITKKGLIEADSTQGNISLMLVDFNYRRKGIGSKLIEMCENKLKSLGVTHIEIGRDTFHFFPGAPLEFKEGLRFLNNKGYKEGYASWDLISDISKVDLEKAIENKGLKINTQDKFVVEEIKDNDKEKLMNFLAKTFPGRWYGDTELFFQNGMECRDIIVIKDTKEDIIIGFSHIYDEKSATVGPGIYWRELLGDNFGGLGPIGVDSDYRKMNLGLTLLYRSLDILKKRGVKRMCIDWTELFDFYGIFNFMPWKGYMHMGKDY